jgi:hypothetical protein
MDPDVGPYSETIKDDLTTIPISIVMDPADLFGPRGLQPPGRTRNEWERLASVTIHPNGTGFQQNSAIRDAGSE